MLSGHFDGRVEAVIELFGLQEQSRSGHRAAFGQREDRQERGAGRPTLARPIVDGFGDLQAKHLAPEVEADAPARSIDFADGSHR
jgi:hypothetical protein